ncbi:MAG: putative bifunctional diguanylate cyclase/phosphodiesterase [Methylovirgula sp.]
MEPNASLRDRPEHSAGAVSLRSGAPSATADEIQLRQVGALYNAHAIVLLNLANAALTILVLRKIYPDWILVSWFGLFGGVILARYLDAKRYQHSLPSAATAAKWGRHLTIGATATGSLWGLAGSIVMVAPNPMYHVFVAFVLGGMMAGAVVVDAAYLPAFIGFVAAAILPTILALLFHGESISTVIGLMLIAFTAVIVFVGLKAHLWMTATIQHELELVSLTADLNAKIGEREDMDRSSHHHAEILRAVTMSAAEILRSVDLDASIPKVLALVGQSASVSRLQLYENDIAPDGAHYVSLRSEWHAPNIISASDLFAVSHIDANASGPSLSLLARGEVEALLTRNARAPFRQMLESMQVLSVLIMPIFVAGQWWGQLGFDDCEREREWTSFEIDALKTLAELIGAALDRAQNFRDLADAGRIIENSSTILYRLHPEPPHLVTYTSHNFARYGYGLKTRQPMPTHIVDIIHEDDRPRFFADLASIVENSNTEARGEFRIKTATGIYIWFDHQIRPIHDETNHLSAIEGILVEINERKIAEEKLEHVVRNDMLTGLPNRTAFLSELNLAFDAAKHGGHAFAVLYLDIDRFKDINDTLGHSRGDELLNALSQRLLGVVRKADFVARLGGDEFAILQIELIDPAGAGTLATKIIRAVATPYSLGDNEIHVTVSIGVSLYRDSVVTAEEILREADLALYQAKDSGRNQYRFHSELIDRQVRERVTLAEELRWGLGRNEFSVFYQPQVELPSEKIIGMEALLRWRHPERGLVKPSIFIPVAEQTGTIQALGQWVLIEVCRQYAAWRAAGLQPPLIGINLSAAQLQEPGHFESDLKNCLARYAIEPGQIELELTESVLMETTRTHSNTIERLRSFGVRIAIDDFGTGYSSLEYLRAYSVNRLKIAQQFVARIPHDAGSMTIVQATLGLAREFKIDAIAEGVENADQLRFLVEAGCTQIQGFYFYRPMPAEETSKLLHELSSRSNEPGPASAREDASNSTPTSTVITGDRHK